MGRRQARLLSNQLESIEMRVGVQIAIPIAIPTPIRAAIHAGPSVCSRSLALLVGFRWAARLGPSESWIEFLASLLSSLEFVKSQLQSRAARMGANR